MPPKLTKVGFYDTAKVIGVALIALAALFLVISVVKISFFPGNKNRPGNNQTRQESAYLPGTQVRAGNDFPTDFPKEVIIGRQTLVHADEVVYPTGNKDATVVYISEKSMAELADLYVEHLRGLNWEVENNQILEGSAIAVANNGKGRLFITIAPLESKTMLTFLYKI